MSESNNKPEGVSVRLGTCALAAVGLACYLRLAAQQPLAGSLRDVFDGNVRLLLLLFYYLVAIAVFLASLMARERMDSALAAHVWPSIVSALVMMCGGLLVHPSLIGLQPSAAAAGIGITAYATGVALFASVWGSVLYRLEQRCALAAVVLSFPLCEILKVVQLSHAVPHSARYLPFVFILLMLVCCITVRTPGEKMVPRCDLSLLKSLPMGDAVFLVLCICTCATASGILSLDEQGVFSTADVVITIGLPLLLCALMLVSSKVQQEHPVVMPASMVVGVIIVIVSLSVAIAFAELENSSRLPESLISLSRLYCAVCLLLLAVRDMHERATSPSMLMPLFGISAFMVPNIIGKFVIPEIDMHTNEMILRYETLFVLGLSALLACMAFVNLSRRRVLVVEDNSGIEAEMRLKKAYDAVASRFKLTARESEVMQLIAEGKSMREIGETLFISLGTVQTHSKNIYRKLGIHSKRELAELVEHEKE